VLHDGLPDLVAHRSNEQLEVVKPRQMLFAQRCLNPLWERGDVNAASYLVLQMGLLEVRKVLEEFWF